MEATGVEKQNGFGVKRKFEPDSIPPADLGQKT